MINIPNSFRCMLPKLGLKLLPYTLTTRTRTEALTSVDKRKIPTKKLRSSEMLENVRNCIEYDKGSDIIKKKFMATLNTGNKKK